MKAAWEGPFSGAVGRDSRPFVASCTPGRRLAGRWLCLPHVRLVLLGAGSGIGLRADSDCELHPTKLSTQLNDVWATAIPMAMSVIGGLGIFMLGMKYMSEGMQAVAGNSLRRMISVVTNNRFTAVGTGIAVTLLVQSSTISTVITVGLVNAGLMQLYQAIGVIVGANIGTTITGWVLVLKIGKYGLPILGIAALFYIFSKRDKPRFIAMSIMGLGMIFFGLELMKDGFAPMKDIPMFVEAFAWFEADSYLGVMKAVLVGCLLTFLVQSSSATLAITIGLAATGVIPFATAAALVLGENIGTTITVMIASIGANVNAKRTAYGHVMFNVFGVLWITLLFPVYIRIISGLIQSVHGADPLTMTLADFGAIEFAAVITAGIALTHTGFNVTNTLLFLPFLRPYARLLERIVPDPTEKEVAQLKHLDARSVSAPVLGVEQSRGEVVQMGRGALKMIDWIRELAFNGLSNQKLIDKTFRREDVLDKIHQEIITFLVEVLDSNVPQSIAEEGRKQLRLAHEYESMSDRMSSVLKNYLRLKERGLELHPDEQQGLLELHEGVTDFLRQVNHAYENRQVLSDSVVQSVNGAIRKRIKRLRDLHLERMTSEPVDPQLSMVYFGLLTDYRRIRAHTLNVHEANVGVIPAEVTA
jgi:phosphate:Na+ symporter